MDKVYVLYSETPMTLDKAHCSVELIRVFNDEEVAHRTSLYMQQNNKTLDVKFRVEAIAFDELVP